MGDARPGLLFVSSITLPETEESSERKKWSRLAENYRVNVLCFSEAGFGTTDRYGCRFHHLPKSLPLAVRVLLYYTVFPAAIPYLTLRHGTDVWIAQSPYEAGAAFLPKLVLFFRSGTRLIVEAHGDWIKSFFELRSIPLSGLVKRLLHGYSRLVLRTADGFRSVSRTTAKLLEHHGPGRIPHETFPTFTDLDFFLETTREQKLEAEADDILYVGALTHLKGIDDLLEALHRLEPDHRVSLRLVGDGPDRDAFEERAGELEITDRVTFEGHCSKEEVRTFLLRSRLLVLPSRTEGMPRVLLEALACFTPFVCTATPGGEELTERSDGGVCVPIESPPDLARAIRNLHDDDHKRHEMGRRGREYVDAHHGCESYFSKYRDLIETVRGPVSSPDEHREDPNNG